MIGKFLLYFLFYSQFYFNSEAQRKTFYLCIFVVLTNLFITMNDKDMPKFLHMPPMKFVSPAEFTVLCWRANKIRMDFLLCLRIAQQNFFDD
jgi:hypothetical protein